MEYEQEQEIKQMIDNTIIKDDSISRDKRKCHLCGSIMKNKYCTNESCAEFE